MTSLDTLARYVAAHMRGRVPAEVVETLKLHAVDTVAAWTVGARTDEGRKLLAYRPQLERDMPGLASQVAINCALARLTEVDDIHIASMTTPGAFVVPAALTIAAAQRQSNEQALCEAMIAGYEAMVRLGAAIDGPTVLYRGIWPSYFSCAFGVAAVAARLLELDPGQAAHALALALNLSGPGVGQHGAPTTARWLAAGFAARNGLAAAQAAQAGFTADTGILDGKYFSGVMDVTPKVAAITRDLGDRHALQEVAFKPWCAARQTMAATQAFSEIIARNVDVAAITAVEAAVPPPMLRMIDHGIVAGDRLSRLTSLPFQIAIAALAPDMAFDVAAGGEVPPAVVSFMPKVRVAAADALADGFPALWRARVRVAVGGGWLEHQIAQIPGDPGRPFALGDVVAKFHRLADKMFGGHTVDRLVGETCDVLDGRAAPGQLMQSIASAVG